MSAYDNFVKAIEDYYGDYRPAVKGLVIEYLKKQISESRLKAFYSILINNYSNKYKIPPDIAEMNKYLKDDNYNRYFPAEGIKHIEEKIEKVDSEEINNLFDKIKNKFEDKTI